MTAYWWYVLKVSTCIVVFYSFYMLVLRNCTFFLVNRIYLIAGLLLSFIIPVLNFSIFKGQSNGVISTFIHPVLIEPDYDYFQTQNTNHVTTILSQIINYIMTKILPDVLII